MKYVNNSGSHMYILVNGETVLVSPGEQIESTEAIKYPGLAPVMATTPVAEKKRAPKPKVKASKPAVKEKTEEQ